MDWLTILRSEMKETTKSAAYEYFPSIGSYSEPYYDLRFEHVKQVETEALRLMQTYSGADKDIVLAAVWTHDRYKPQFDGEDHTNKAADWVAENLESKGFSKEKIFAVEYAVRNHGGWKKKRLDTLEAQILWDADKLSHQGPSYLFQNFFTYTTKQFCNNERINNVVFNPTISLENILPALLTMRIEMDFDSMIFSSHDKTTNYSYNASDYFHLDKSLDIVIEKIKSVNSFVEALQKQL